MKNFSKILPQIFLFFLLIYFSSCPSPSDSTPKIVTYQVIFDSNGGNDVNPQTVISGNKVVYPRDPSKSGYYFDGWYTDVDLLNIYNFDNPVYKDTFLYAKWNDVIIDISFIEILTDGTDGIRTTTKITLKFDKVINSLTLNDIEIIDTDQTGAKKESLVSKGNGSYELNISEITKNGEITIKMSRDGYKFAPDSKLISIFYVVPIEFINLQLDNEKGTTTTKKLIMTLDKAINDLNIEDVNIVDTDNTNVNKQSLIEIGNGVYELSLINVCASGMINVSLEKFNYSFTPSNKNIKIYYVPVFFTSEELKTWLMSQTLGANTSNPVSVSYGGSESIQIILNAIDEAWRYINLDLSMSNVSGFVFGSEPGREKIVSLVLPYSLTDLTDGISGSSIFAGFTNLISISGANVTNIGSYCFSGCSNLRQVQFPEAITIKDSAFSSCSRLSIVEMQKVKTIGSGAFASCSLGNISINFPVATTVGNNAFSWCQDVKEINLPEATSIGDYAFYRIFISKVVLPKVTSIGVESFLWSSITTLEIKSVEIIGNNAFRECNNLTSIYIGPTPPEIGNTIFENIASSSKTIRFYVPNSSHALYMNTSPFKTNDKLGLNNTNGYFWDNNSHTKEKLTVLMSTY